MKTTKINAILKIPSCIIMKLIVNIILRGHGRGKGNTKDLRVIKSAQDMSA